MNVFSFLECRSGNVCVLGSSSSSRWRATFLCATVVCGYEHEISPLCGTFLAFKPQRGLLLPDWLGGQSGIVRFMSNSVNKDQFLFSPQQLKEMNVDQPTPLIDGLLPSRDVTVFSGPTGIGKSFMTLDWAIHLAGGMDWNGFTVEKPHTVVYVVGQGWNSFGQRIEAWEKEHNEEVSDRLCFIDGDTWPTNMSVDSLKDYSQRYLSDIDPDLIIFDPFSILISFGVVDDDLETARAFLRARHLLNELDTSILFVHHDDSLLRYADTVITANELNYPGDFYISTKFEDGGRSPIMKPQCVKGFCISPFGMLTKFDEASEEWGF